MTRAAAILVLAGFAALLNPGEAGAQAPLKIGVLTEISGPFGSTGSNERDGFLLYLKKAGGVLAGRKVTAIVEDTANDPAVAISKAKKLIESDKIDVLVGPISSASGAAIRQYVVEQKMPTLLAATVDGILDGKYMYRTTFSGDAEGYLDGYLAGTHGYKRAVTIAPDYSAGHTSAVNVERGFKATGGTVLKQLFPRIGLADYGSIIGQLPSDADVAIVFLPGADGVRFIKQYADYGKPLPLHGPSATVDEAYLATEGKAAQGFIGSSFYFSVVDNAENRAFVAAWKAEYPTTPGWFSVSGYIAGQILDAALRKTRGNTADRDAFTAALKETRLATPAGPFRFDKMNDPISNRYVVEIREVAGEMKPVIFATIADYSTEDQPPKLPPGLAFPK